LLLLAGCSTKLLASGQGEEARFQHRELGYTIAYPSVLNRPDWETRRIDESDLLVRHPDSSAWALSSQCRATLARPRLLAGELARATGGSLVEPGHAIRHANLDGWSQRLVRREGERVLEIKTVTLRGTRCTYDWILLAPSPARFAELEPAFDRWWQSFEPGPTDRPGEDAT